MSQKLGKEKVSRKEVRDVTESPDKIKYAV